MAAASPGQQEQSPLPFDMRQTPWLSLPADGKNGDANAAPTIAAATSKDTMLSDVSVMILPELYASSTDYSTDTGSSAMLAKDWRRQDGPSDVDARRWIAESATESAMRAGCLLPGATDLRCEQVCVGQDLITIDLSSAADGSGCPQCVAAQGHRPCHNGCRQRFAGSLHVGAGWSTYCPKPPDLRRLTVSPTEKCDPSDRKAEASSNPLQHKSLSVESGSKHGENPTGARSSIG